MRRTEVDAAERPPAGEVLAVRAMNGRPVPCLTQATQLIFRTGFHLEAAGSGDVALLRSKLGSATGSSGT